MDPEAMNVIQSYQWPGNVRELQNTIERSYYLASPPHIRLRDLPTSILGDQLNLPERNLQELSYHDAKEQVLEDFEKNYLKIQLMKHEWNISKTADSCGIDRRTIHRLINKYNLKS